MKAVVFYESAAGLAETAPLHAAAHVARWREFAGRGELLMIGPFANAQEDGAMGIFTTREAAEEFVRGDPFVLHGVSTELDYPRMERSPGPRPPRWRPLTFLALRGSHRPVTNARRPRTRALMDGVLRRGQDRHVPLRATCVL